MMDDWKERCYDSNGQGYSFFRESSSWHGVSKTTSEILSGLRAGSVKTSKSESKNQGTCAYALYRSQVILYTRATPQG
jgi:hypothetical protein